MWDKKEDAILIELYAEVERCEQLEASEVTLSNVSENNIAKKRASIGLDSDTNRRKNDQAVPGALEQPPGSHNQARKLDARGRQTAARGAKTTWQQVEQDIPAIRRSDGKRGEDSMEIIN